MTTLFSTADIALNLNRYPVQTKLNLQAWDAADEHLLKQLAEKPTLGSALIINDTFGALLCAIKQRSPQTTIQWVSDAKTSHLGAQHNLAQNHLTTNGIKWLNAREPINPNVQAILMKLPKNLTYFAGQLAQLSQILPAGTEVLVAAKAKSINSALIALIHKQLGTANASLAWKKTRVISIITDGKVRQFPLHNSWDIPDYNLKISNLSNVFASNKLDIGAQFLLKNLPSGEFNTVIDLGCGNGVLGLRAAQLYPNATIHFIDDSEMAIASCKLNWEHNRSDNNAQFYWDDCLTHLPQQVQADLVLCNPPFHQGEAITDHIAWQMFLDAKQRLAKNGVLHIVGNRHLGYHVKLKRLFGNCKTIASNGKFVILQSIKAY